MQMLLVLLTGWCLIPSLAWAASAATAEPSWRNILAAFINTTVVLVLVQVLKLKVLPVLRAGAPALLPIIAGALGPLVALVQTAVSAWLGYPIDLSMLLALFTGASAVAVNQVIKHGVAPTSRLRTLLG